MNNSYKEPYEISVWEDILEKEQYTDVETGEVKIRQFYREEKIAIIGTDQMDSAISVVEPTLVLNTNGATTLTFSLFFEYYDDETGDKLKNPFISLLVNERKIKIQYKDKWYDLVIKNIDEDKLSKRFNYTAKDLHINELSKNGFNLEYDTDLENNQGTIIELAAKIVEGTDWTIDKTNSEIIQQTKEEALYEIVIDEEITATNMEDKESTIVIPRLSTILVFYNTIALEDPFLQFLYVEKNLYEKDSDRIIINSPNYYIDNTTYKTFGDIKIPTFALSGSISTDFRGKRLVRKQKSTFDKTTDLIVDIYEDANGKEIYSFTNNEYISPTIVQSSIVNGKNFIDTSGWLESSGVKIDRLIYPPIVSRNWSGVKSYNYLTAEFDDANGVIYNSGIKDNINVINNFTAGERYTFRIKYGRGAIKAEPTRVPVTEGLRLKVAEYTLTDGVYELGTTYFDFNGNLMEEALEVDETLPFQSAVATCQQSLSRGEISTKKIGLFLYLKGTNNYSFSIDEVQFYPYKTDADGTVVKPGDSPNAIVKTIYNYYYPNPKAESLDDIILAYKGEKKSSEFTSVFSDDYEKIRSIKASESNRFNLIQTICETFECWADFEISHNELTGEILLDPITKKQLKSISFHNFIGQENDKGFRYGINLRSIKRQLESDQIVSKIIVKPNSNEYATDGFCAIGRATENPIKEDYIYNFNHYVQQGLLDFTQLTNDLYLTENGYIGLYTKLRELNLNRETKIKEIEEINKVLYDLNSSVQVYQLAYDSAEESLIEQKQDLRNACGYNYQELTVDNPSTEIKKVLENDLVVSMVDGIIVNERSRDEFFILLTQAKDNVSKYQDKYEKINEYIDTLYETKNKLDSSFFSKYSRFIQEGTWISEEYIDDNLYFLDAESVLNTSSKPKITYTIDVLELSQLEEYQNYTFNIGDKTYIEDTEFFGWVIIDGVKTPYKEEIIISEISYNLDQPGSNQIKVQNFKTSFEDLFQRIAAETQSLQYSSGSYDKVAGVITTNGFLKPQTLQNSFNNNSIILSNAQDQSVEWGTTGITIKNLRKPNEIVRLVSGGILMTNDGGTTWNVGITGNGINANYLSTGQIDASRINIMGGAFAAFRWDATGLNAYRFTRNPQTNLPEFFNFNKFVRFDQYGIYGVDGDDKFIPNSFEEIKTKANFGLTWNGFFLKSNHKNTASADDGRIEISTEDDFQVFDGNNIERIKIGQLGKPNSYGMKIFDLEGAPVMETNDLGQLWLKQKLMVGPEKYTPRAQLGTIETFSDPEGDYSKIFSVKNIEGTETIAFYDNGRLEAKDVDLTGRIEATSGKIGNVDIADVTSGLKGLKVTAPRGDSFKVSKAGISPNQLYFSALMTSTSAEENRYSWSGSQNGTSWESISSGSNLVIMFEDVKDKFDINGLFFLKAEYLDTDGKVYSNYLTLKRVDDGVDGGSDAVLHNIELNQNEILKFIVEGNQLVFAPSSIKMKGVKMVGLQETILSSEFIGYRIFLQEPTPSIFGRNGWVELNRMVREVIEDPDNPDSLIDIGEIESPIKSCFYFDEDTFTYNFDIDRIYSEAPGTDLFTSYIKRIIEDDNLVARIELVDVVTDSTYTKSIVPINFGTSHDMAAFAVTATGIQASVQNSKLLFDVDGLHIYEAGFEIIKNRLTEAEEKVFHVDTDGNLRVKGIIEATDGIFNGTIYADAGRFKGEINATSGFLGDLSVNGLIDINKSIYIDGRKTVQTLEEEVTNPNLGIYSFSYATDPSKGFFISANGEITANSIKLGEQATISQYLKLGDSWIFNPSAYDSIKEDIKISTNLDEGTFLLVRYGEKQEDTSIINKTAFSLNANGTMRIGNNGSGIIFNGKEESIQSYSYGVNSGWKIDTDKAEFNNIIARGSIKASVLEYSETQSIGGVLVVRPSSIIKSYRKDPLTNDIVVVLENRNGFMPGDFCKIDFNGSEVETLFKIELKEGVNGVDEGVTIGGNSEDGEEITLIGSKTLTQAQINSLSGKPLINLGKHGSTGIGINSSNNNAMIPGNSLSIFTSEVLVNEGTGEETLNIVPNILLGKIPDEDRFGNLRGTYGLYADNVLLKGAMVAAGKDFSSGINTESPAVEKNQNYFPGKSLGSILLWAGAKDDKIDSIEKANFRVDSYGNIYAGSGYFNGTIITDATITAAEIKTATITGWRFDSKGNELVDEPAALVIRDASYGISFMEGTVERLGLKATGLQLNTNLKVGDRYTVREDSAVISPVEIIYDSLGSSRKATVLQPNSIGFVDIGIPEDISNIPYLGYINYNEGININDSGTKIATFKKDNASFHVNTELKRTVIYGDIMEYRPALDSGNKIIGYDLYFRE